MSIPNLKWIELGIAVCATAGIAWLLHEVNVDVLEANHRSQISQLKDSYIKSCNEDKDILRKINDELHKTNAFDADRTAANKRLHPTACVMPKPRVAQLHTQPEGSNRQDGGVAGTSDDFRDYALDYANCQAVVKAYEATRDAWEKK